MGAGSKINGKGYEVVHNTDIKDMPSSLIDWLLASVTLADGQTVTKPQPKARANKVHIEPSKDIQYITYNAELCNILELLPNDL